MYSVTEKKIRDASMHLWEIHGEKEKYRKIIHLLDEPYQLALAIMDFPSSATDKEIAEELSINEHTAHRVRYLIGH